MFLGVVVVGKVGGFFVMGLGFLFLVWSLMVGGGNWAFLGRCVDLNLDRLSVVLLYLTCDL